MNELPYIAFNTLITSLHADLPHYKTKTTNLKPHALFVTLEIDGELRGCIGTFAPRDLPNGVKEFALKAANEDPRFPRLEKHEVELLEISITVLGKMKPIDNKYDWEIGKHGVYVDFGLGKTATFLPEVAETYNWTKDETFEMLRKKANASSKKNMRVFVYEGVKYKCNFMEYIDACN